MKQDLSKHCYGSEENLYSQILRTEESIFAFKGNSLNFCFSVIPLAEWCTPQPPEETYKTFKRMMEEDALEDCLEEQGIFFPPSSFSKSFLLNL